MQAARPLRFEIRQLRLAKCDGIELSDFRYCFVDIQTLGTLESALVVPRFVRLSVVKPHHATALGALRVFPRTSDLRITHRARTRVVVTL